VYIRYKGLNNILSDFSSSPKDRTTELLKILELLHARLALTMLSDWQTVGYFSPNLYQPISGLSRPSWGNWNRLITELVKARKEIYNSNHEECIKRFEELKNFGIITDFLEIKIEKELADEIILSAKVMNISLKRIKISNLLETAITLRNRIAHSSINDEWYDNADKLLILLSKAISDSLKNVKIATENQSPWFYTNNGIEYQYNGIIGKEDIEYVAYNEKPYNTSETISEVTKQFASLLGAKEKSFEDIKKLIREAAPEEFKGVIIGNYLVGKPVAEGGFAFLHKAINMNTGAETAVKILKFTDDINMKERFQHESELMSQINHNNAVKIFDHGEEVWTQAKDISLKDEEWFKTFSMTPVKNCIFMEWIDGLTLDHLYRIEKIEKDVSFREVLSKSREIMPFVDNKSRLENLKNLLKNLPKNSKDNEKFITEWFKISALTLQHVHDQNLIHRDIKPSNIMITRFCEVKIMDFGIARSYNAEHKKFTQTGTAIGTEAYMSPEQIQAETKAKELGPKTDIYSLGSTFYEMFTRSRLYDHDTTDMMTIHTKKINGVLPERPRLRRKDLSWELNEIILGTLQAEASLRYVSMLDLAEDLKRYENSESILYKKSNIWKRMVLAYKRYRLEKKMMKHC